MDKAVFRRVAFPVGVFDYLKQYQRELAALHGLRLNNNETLARILREHQQAHSAESEERNHAQPE